MYINIYKFNISKVKKYREYERYDSFCFAAFLHNISIYVSNWSFSSTVIPENFNIEVNKQLYNKAIVLTDDFLVVVYYPLKALVYPCLCLY